MPESKGPVWDFLLNICTNPDGHFYWEGDRLLFEIPSFSWAANHLQKKKRYFVKQTSSNLNINQLNSQKNTEMPLTSTFIQSGSLPVISYIYITPLIGVKKNVKLIYFAAIFRGPKKTPAINCLFYNNLFKIHLGSCPTSRGRVFSRRWFFTNPFKKTWWSNWIIAPGVKIKKTFETTLPELTNCP